MVGLLAGQLVSSFYGTIFEPIGCGADGQMGTEHRARGVLDWGHVCVHLELLPRQLGFCTLQLYALIDERPLLHPRIRCAHAALARTHSTRASAALDARSWRCELTCQWCAVLLTGNLNWQLRRCGLWLTPPEFSRRTSSSTAGDVGISQHHYYITLPSPDGTPSH